jgi:hypothetical protein
MIKFVNGPAKGQHLLLKRAPEMLRVTYENGVWDALDQPHDTPKPGEKIYAYKNARTIGGMCHIYRGKNGSGFYAIAQYVFFEPQPTDDQMRNGWENWVKTLP